MHLIHHRKTSLLLELLNAGERMPPNVIDLKPFQIPELSWKLPKQRKCNERPFGPPTKHRWS